MGTAMARRLLAAGESVMVWNRTPAKAQALVDEGAVLAESLAALGACPVVFVMVSGSDDLIEVLDDERGLLADPRGLRVVVDCSTVSVEASAAARRLVGAAGAGYVAAPISGNPAVVGAGDACFAASGPQADYALVEPLLLKIAKSAVRVGDEEQSRLVKLCHNLYLGMMVQALVEVTSLAEKAGADREQFLRFLGDTIVGSQWVRQRTPSFAARDWTPTFTTTLLRKDFDLGLAAAREHEVPMLLAGSVHQLIQAAIAHGLGEQDLLSLYELQAASAGLA
jgi:3-hydroxyisobutyrate dehydrogenase-like beta-hydroxyacid dehydrogenase